MIIELLTLVCEGTSNTPSQMQAQTTVPGSFESSTTTINTRSRVNDRLTVEINGDAVRVKPPRSLVPPLSGNGNDGWRDLTEVSITEREIRGRFSFSWVNKPWVRIDRATGEIEIRNANVIAGQSGFNGTCAKVDQNQRLF